MDQQEPSEQYKLWTEPDPPTPSWLFTPHQEVKGIKGRRNVEGGQMINRIQVPEDPVHVIFIILTDGSSETFVALGEPFVLTAGFAELMSINQKNLTKLQSINIRRGKTQKTGNQKKPKEQREILKHTEYKYTCMQYVQHKRIHLHTDYKQTHGHEQKSARLDHTENLRRYTSC